MYSFHRYSGELPKTVRLHKVQDQEIKWNFGIFCSEIPYRSLFRRPPCPAGPTNADASYAGRQTWFYII